MKKLKDYVKYVVYSTRDPQRDVSERFFIVLSLVSVLIILSSLAADAVLGVGTMGFDSAILLASCMVNLPITIICLCLNKIRLAEKLVLTVIVFVIYPTVFLYNLGVDGGGATWFIFIIIFIGLVLRGVWRNTLLFLTALITVGCYYYDYTHPELFADKSKKIMFINSFMCLLVVGAVCFLMISTQRRLFKNENKKAKRETQRAEELNISQNRFFSSMSHEIRTPINSILGLNELILRQRDVSEDVIRDALGIKGAGNLLLALINDILDFSKIKAGSMDIIPVDYRVGNMISEIVNMMWLRAEEKGLKFNVSIDPGVPSVLYGDEVRIKQILINLLNNAVKYTKEGTIALYIESKNIDENTVSLRISVSDTGIGIKKDSIPYLFDMFKRVDEEKNRYIEGTGLGLSIVKQLIDLMGGTIAVDSVYGEGSTFTVTLKQGISEKTPVGELNIHNLGEVRSQSYESSFEAPTARILIVDDNELNLEVEKRLLEDTRIQVDTVLKGRDALDRTLEYHYDVILMDHLMPEMDGIECLQKLRNQVGGLNRDVPVVVLTANAGSENRELYHKVGFDGYIVKPVSGSNLENILIRHINKDKVNLRRKAPRMENGIKTARGYARKVPVVIACSSIVDIPESLIRRLNLAVIPFLLQTDGGIFKDGSQIVADELIRHIREGGNALSMAQNSSQYTEIFADLLKKAHHLIYIAVSSSMATDFERASEAAEAFDNVTVINSGSMSSGTGILALIASRLVGQDIPVDEIIRELNEAKHRIQCSFVLEETGYMTGNRLVSKKGHAILSALQIHPCLRVRENRSGIGGIWFGNMRKAYRGYIKKAFPIDITPDPDIVFITYVDVAEEILLMFGEEVLKHAPFKKVVFQQATAAISSNSGPGCIGILYYTKGEKSYNIGAFLSSDEGSSVMDQESLTEKRADEKAEAGESASGTKVSSEEKKSNISWCDSIDGIDVALALQNSGSQEAFRVVLELFYKAIDTKAEELEKFFYKKDWKNYTIKVHALKSSARLIGAVALADEAEALEYAGKEENIDFIGENHKYLIINLLKYKERLFYIFEDSAPEAELKAEKGSELQTDYNEDDDFDDYLMESVYESLKEAAEGKDKEIIRSVFAEIEEYSLSAEHMKRMEELKSCFENDDLAGMVRIMEESGNE
ncbi:MAG: DegV family EDD domain-containing protein [Lachnospiraceae bacterium]|nr:DegV family EDD domain-containing protein [Lachnospiraceae bacterium]